MSSWKIRGMILLPLLFYLSMSSGLPPGSVSYQGSPLQENNVIYLVNSSSGKGEVNIIPHVDVSSSSDINNEMDENYEQDNKVNTSPATPIQTSTPPTTPSVDETKMENPNVEQSEIENVELSRSTNSPTTFTSRETTFPATVTTTATNTLPPETQKGAVTSTSLPITESQSDQSDESKSEEQLSNGASTTTHDTPVFAAQRQTTVPTLPPPKPTIEPTVPLRGKCNSTDQCIGDNVDCRVSICKCALGYLPRIDNGALCGEASAHHVEVPTADPTMIGVVIGLALMSVTLCIVLRLFAKARFRENRTIFNTPNPRLMNVSLLKGSKSLLRGNSGGGHRSRRGSQASIASGTLDGSGASHPEGNGMAMAGSSNSHRSKPSRQLSTDTTNTESTPSNKPHSAIKSKFRQDSSASNV